MPTIKESSDQKFPLVQVELNSGEKFICVDVLSLRICHSVMVHIKMSLVLVQHLLELNRA